MHSDPRSSSKPLAIATMLTPTERLRVDAAGDGWYQTIHRDSVAELVQDLKTHRARVPSLSRSPAATRPSEPPSPRSCASSRASPPSRCSRAWIAPRRRPMLSLGSTGVRQLVDVRDADGWRELRNYLLTTRGEDIQREALGQLAIDLAGVSHDCWRFFEALFLVPAHVSTVRALARRLDVLPSTLMSRFFRAHLPAPKRYLAMARLVRAARLFENPGFSVANVANHLDYSSPQSFGRHVRMVLDMTALQMRDSLRRSRNVRALPGLARDTAPRRLRRLRPLAPTWGSPPARNVVH